MVQIIRNDVKNSSQEGHDGNGKCIKSMQELVTLAGVNLHMQDQADAGLEVPVQMAMMRATETDGKILTLACQLSALQTDTKAGWAGVLDKIALLVEVCADLEQSSEALKADCWQVRE